MHAHSCTVLNNLRREYIESFYGRVLELGSGSQDITFSVRPWFKGCKEYVGVDPVPGAGVDIVARAVETKFEEGHFDTLISFSMLEHDLTWRESLAHNLPFLKEDGMLFMCWGAEGNDPHMDVWALVPHQEVIDFLKEKGIEIIDSFFEEERFGPDTSNVHGSYTLIARKKISKPTVTVIVFSYNRPRMLQEALKSIRDADEVIVVDDGSDFNVAEVVNKFKFPTLSLIGAPQITVEERAKNQRLPALTNEALRQAKGDIITYLCDDDLFGEEWCSTLKTFYTKHGEKYHWVRGHCIRFESKKDLSFEEQTKHLLVWAESPRQLITGNFAHLRKCFTKENIQWNETKVWGHDTAFFDNAEKFHDTWCVPLIPTVACFRRIHDKMLTNHCFLEEDGTMLLDQFSPSAIEMIKENKFLE